MNIIDQDGNQLVKGSKRLGHLMPELFAVDVDVVRESFNKASRIKESLRESLFEGLLREIRRTKGSLKDIF